MFWNPSEAICVPRASSSWYCFLNLYLWGARVLFVGFHKADHEDCRDWDEDQEPDGQFPGEEPEEPEAPDELHDVSKKDRNVVAGRTLN